MGSTFLLLTVSASLAACGLVNPNEVTSERSASAPATTKEVESENFETILVLPPTILPADNEPSTTLNPLVIPPLPTINPDGGIKNPYYSTVA